MNKLLQTEVAWLAGLFEGEGSTGVYKNRNSYAVRLNIPQHTRSVDVLHRVREILGVGNVSKSYKTKTGYVSFYTLTKKSDVYSLVKKMYPYLSARRQAQCDRVINYIIKE